MHGIVTFATIIAFLLGIIAQHMFDLTGWVGLG